MQIEERLTQFLIPKLEEVGAFLVEMKIHQGKKVLLFIDSEEGISIDICAGVSKKMMNEPALEDVWNAHGLEVSSPGLDKPLKHIRQYVKNKGRDVLIELTEGERKKGKIVAVGEDSIELEEKINKEIIISKIKLSDILKTTIEIKF